MIDFEFWKLKRELRRIGQQIGGVYDGFLDPYKQRKLDSLVERGLRTHEGVALTLNKIAIYLIFQPKGLRESTVATCRWLHHNGYAPLVITNASISDSHRKELLAVCWRLVERPNFGYDFGGYRDGLTCLRKWGISPIDLIILNDSVWLPIFEDEGIFSRISTSEKTILGAIERERNGKKFLESYFYRIHGDIIKNPQFLEFWNNIKLTSNKYHVIRRGERGFSDALVAADLTLQPLYETSTFLQRVCEVNNDFLYKTLAYASYVDSFLEVERTALLMNHEGENWRVQVLNHIARALKKRQAYSTFPYAMVKLFKFPFLKKSNDQISKGWRLKFLKAVENGDIPTPASVYWNEIRSHDKSN